jgi:hypothetical protein
LPSSETNMAPLSASISSLLPISTFFIWSGPLLWCLCISFHTWLTLLAHPAYSSTWKVEVMHLKTIVSKLLSVYTVSHPRRYYSSGFVVQWKFIKLLVCFGHNENGVAMFQVVNEMATAAGLTCKVDPTLVAALRSQKNGNRIIVLSSIRVAQDIYVSHFISSINGILYLRYLFNSYTASHSLPVFYHLHCPVGVRLPQWTIACTHLVQHFFAAIKCLLRNFSWIVQKCVIVAAWNSSTKEKWHFYRLQNKWFWMKWGVTFQHHCNDQYSFTQFENYVAWQCRGWEIMYCMIQYRYSTTDSAVESWINYSDSQDITCKWHMLCYITLHSWIWWVAWSCLQHKSLNGNCILCH